MGILRESISSGNTCLIVSTSRGAYFVFSNFNNKFMLNHIKNLYKGRLGRLDYFLTFIFVLIPIVIAMSIAGLLRNLELDNLSSIFEIFSVIYAITIPFTLVGAIIKRGHDIGWSGWFSVFMFLIGQLIIIPNLLLLFQRGDRGENEYGLKQEGHCFKRLFTVK